MKIDKDLLKKLKNNDPSIRCLNFYRAGLTDKDLRQIARALEKNDNVIGINLGNCRRSQFFSKDFPYEHNLVLISKSRIELTEQSLEHISQQHGTVPLLIRKGDEFLIWGRLNKKWQATMMEDGEGIALFQQLGYEKGTDLEEKIHILENSEVFNILKKGHTFFSTVVTEEENENIFTELGIQFLARCKSIKYLFLCGNKLSNTGLKQLSTLPNLSMLWISECEINIDDAKILLEFKKLKFLDDGSNPYQDHPEFDKIDDKITEMIVQNKNVKHMLSFYIQQAFKAAMDGELEKLKELLPKLPDGIRTVETVEYQETLLHTAAVCNQVNIAKFLLNQGANVEARNMQDYTPLFIAAERGYSEMVNLLHKHVANIQGEFKFNDETSYSIACFKFCEKACDIIKCILKSSSPVADLFDQFIAKHDVFFKLWENLFDMIDESPWIVFGKSEEIRDPFIDMATSCFNEFKSIIGQYQEIKDKKILEIIRQGEEYYSIIKDCERIERIADELPMTKEQSGYLSDSAPSDDSDMDEDKPEIRKHAFLISNDFENNYIPKKAAPKNSIEQIINDLNEEIHRQSIENIDWSKYPKFYIAQYRGMHFYRNKFTPLQRKNFRETCHLNRSSAAAAAYELADSSVKKASHTRESCVEDAIELLRLWHLHLSTVKECEAYWQSSKSKRIFDTMRDLVQMRWSNSMPGFLEDLKNPDNSLKKILSALGNTDVPYYATSDLPYHALRYAYGQKPDKASKPWRLRPRFQMDGATKRPYPGKIFIYLFSPGELSIHNPNHTVDLHWRGLVDIGTRILPERESIFPGGISQSCAFLEQNAKIPSFSGIYKLYYLEKYGLTEDKFNSFKKNIIESLSKIKDANSSDEHRKVKNIIINHLVGHHESVLRELVETEVRRRKGYLIYRDINGTFSLQPPLESKIRDGHNLHKKSKKNARNKHADNKERHVQSYESIKKSLESSQSEQHTLKRYKRPGNTDYLNANKKAKTSHNCEDNRENILSYTNQLDFIKTNQESLSANEIEFYCHQQQIEGFKKITMDGNCFFRSVLAALGQDENNHLNLRRQAIDYIQRNKARFNIEENEVLDNYLNEMCQDGAWAYGEIIEAAGLMLNIQIDVIQLTTGTLQEGLIMTEGRFTAAAIPDAPHTILLLRVNENHYHATGCKPIMSSVSANVTLRAPILSKDKYDKLFPHSEDKEQWLKATEFMTRCLSLSENQQLELKFEFEGMQAYFRNSKAYIARQKASGAISEELFEKMNNYLNLVLEEGPAIQSSPRPGRR